MQRVTDQIIEHLRKDANEGFMPTAIAERTVWFIENQFKQQETEMIIAAISGFMDKLKENNIIVELDHEKAISYLQNSTK